MASRMPELPEVEYAAGRFRQAALGRTIASVAALHPSAARSLPAAACRRLAGRQITEIARRAKIQLVTLDDGQLIEVHFRMTGDWDIGHAADAAPAYERVRIECTDGTRVSLVDSRAFGIVRVHAPGDFVLPELGPEPLEHGFTVKGFATQLASRRGPIKPALLDQTLVAGVGNIYAAEALWVANIHPTRVAASLSHTRVTLLRDAIREVLHAAPVGRYYAASDDARTDEDAWRVYGREGEPCTRCGRPIKRITQAGRSTFYCGGCQR